MRMLVTGKQMKAIDAYTIRTIGIPSLVLMERAALKVALAAERLWEKGPRRHAWHTRGARSR